jgi:hypothetical protein
MNQTLARNRDSDIASHLTQHNDAALYRHSEDQLVERYSL